MFNFIKSKISQHLPFSNWHEKKLSDKLTISTKTDIPAPRPTIEIPNMYKMSPDPYRRYSMKNGKTQTIVKKSVTFDIKDEDCKSSSGGTPVRRRRIPSKHYQLFQMESKILDLTDDDDGGDDDDGDENKKRKRRIRSNHYLLDRVKNKYSQKGSDRPNSSYVHSSRPRSMKNYGVKKRSSSVSDMEDASQADAIRSLIQSQASKPWPSPILFPQNPENPPKSLKKCESTDSGLDERSDIEDSMDDIPTIQVTTYTDGEEADDESEQENAAVQEDETKKRVEKIRKFRVNLKTAKGDRKKLENVEPNEKVQQELIQIIEKTLRKKLLKESLNKLREQILVELAEKGAPMFNKKQLEHLQKIKTGEETKKEKIIRDEEERERKKDELLKLFEKTLRKKILDKALKKLKEEYVVKLVEQGNIPMFNKQQRESLIRLTEPSENKKKKEGELSKQEEELDCENPEPLAPKQKSDLRTVASKVIGKNIRRKLTVQLVKTLDVGMFTKKQLDALKKITSSQGQEQSSSDASAPQSLMDVMKTEPKPNKVEQHDTSAAASTKADVTTKTEPTATKSETNTEKKSPKIENKAATKDPEKKIEGKDDQSVKVAETEQNWSDQELLKKIQKTKTGWVLVDGN